MTKAKKPADAVARIGTESGTHCSEANNVSTPTSNRRDLDDRFWIKRVAVSSRLTVIATLRKSSRKQVRISVFDGEIELRIFCKNGLQQFIETSQCVRLHASGLPALRGALDIAERVIIEGRLA